jgi:RNA polymerase sigma-70 factor (ECF subfamily)
MDEHEDQHNWLAERFEENRPHLRAVAYRMLGSLNEADDAVQESWLRLSRSDTSGVANLGGWLTTVVARVCLDMLRARKARREEPAGAHVPESLETRAGGINPEDEAVLADSVGLALLVVLDTLNPAERIAFVLHDIFDVPFDEVAPIVGRSPMAARQLASRARRRVQGQGPGAATARAADLAPQRAVVEAFLAASRAGNFDALLAMLDPNVVFHADHAAAAAGAPSEVRGAAAVARRFSGRAQGARPALVDGALGVVVARRGRLFLVLNLTVTGGRIAEINAVADPERLRRLKLAVLNDRG